MLEEAIGLINKQIEMYKIQDSNIMRGCSKHSIQSLVKEKLQKEIAVREYILKILQQKKEGKLWID